MEGKKPKNVWWNKEIKDAALKEVLAASNEEAKERCMEAYREEKRKVKRSVYQSKKKVSEQFGRKVTEDVNGNKKLFWKEMNNTEGRKVESCSRIKDGNGSLTQGEDEMGRI